jgi:low temperature requirement protein LtrA
LLIVAVLAVAIICGLWWSYFTRAKPLLDEALASRRAVEQSEMARDVFSLFHFPMLLGVIAFAVAVEEALAHPSDPLPLGGRVALAVGLFLFVGGTAVAIWRATRHFLFFRVILIAGTALTVVALSGVPLLITLLIALAGIVITIIVEQRADKFIDIQPHEFQRSS